MKKQTYLRMTHKSPLRGFKLFKHKFLTRDRFFALCAFLHLVREVKSFPSHFLISNDTLNKVRLLNERIETDRGIFNLSYRGEGKVYEAHWYYESLFKHKRLHTIAEYSSTQILIQVRSECEQFEVYIDPIHHYVVNRSKPVVIMLPQKNLVMVSDPKDIETAKIKHMDFLNTRFAIEVKADTREGLTVEEAVKECLNRAKVQIRNFIEANSETINERLSGIKHDGEFVTPDDNQRLIPNTCCHRCGCPVFFSSVPDYFAQCLVHDEDLYSIETDKVDPIEYKKRYDFFKEQLYHLTHFEK